MHDWQKEVQLSLLNSEEEALKELEKQYKEALKEITDKVKTFQFDIDLIDQALSQEGLDENAKALLKSQKQSKIYQKQYQEALQGQISGIVDKMQGDHYNTIESYLKESYEDAYVGTMYDLAKQGIPIIAPIDQQSVVKAVLTDSNISQGYYNKLGVDYAKLKKNIAKEISRGIATGLSYSDIARNINNVSQSGLSNAKRIARTEGHRVQQEATVDAQYKARSKGADVLKQWDATLDGATRESHRIVDGEIRELDEEFSNGLMFPGDPSGGAAEVCNCRCASLTRARWALDEDELKTLQDRAAYHDLYIDDDKKEDYAKVKAKNFDEFKSKYLNIDITAEAEYNLVKAGRVEANGRFVNKTEKLYRYAAKIKPIEGYEDFTCHASPDEFYIDMVGNGDDKDYATLTPEYFAEAIRNSKTYKGGNVRLISCQSGAFDDGAAQKVANYLGVKVLAPTEIVNLDENGEMFLSDNDILAEIWYNSKPEERKGIKETGKWREFEPRKE